MRYTNPILLSFSSLLALVSGNAIRFYSSQGSCSNGYSGCENLNANVCCVPNSARYSVSISKAPLDVAVGWFEEDDLNCGQSVCTAGGSGTLCCAGQSIPRYTGGSFYTIRNKMRRDTAEKCTSTQAANVFGIAVGDGQYLQIGASEVKARTTFDALHATFQDLAPADAKAWLEENGAVLVKDNEITQTIVAVSTS